MATAASKPKHAPSTKLALDDVLKSLQDLIRNDLPEVSDAPRLDVAHPAPAPQASPDAPRPTAKDLILELEAGLADLTLPDTATAVPPVPVVEPAIALPATDPAPVAAKAVGPEVNDVAAPKVKTPSRPPSPQLAALLADLAAFGSSPAPQPSASTVTPAPDKVSPAQPAPATDKTPVATKAARPEKQKAAAPKAVTRTPTPPPSPELTIVQMDMIPFDANPAPVPAVEPAITYPVAAKAAGPEKTKAAGPEKKGHATSKTTALPLAPPSLDSQGTLPRADAKGKDTPTHPRRDLIKGVRRALDPAAPPAAASPREQPLAELSLLPIPDTAATTSRPSGDKAPGAMIRPEPAPASPKDTHPGSSAGAPQGDERVMPQVTEFLQDESITNIDLDVLDGVQPMDNPAVPRDAAFLQDEPATGTDLDTLDGVQLTDDPATSQGAEFLQEQPAAATELAALDGVHLDFSDHGDTFAIERDQSLSTAPETHAPTQGLSWHTPELTLPAAEPVDASLSALDAPMARRAPGGVQPELPLSHPAPNPPAAARGPNPPSHAEDGDIPLLQDVIDAVGTSTSAMRASMLGKPTAEQAHRMAIQVAARLNVELRRSGKRTLSSDIITRLARMLQETLAQSPSNVDNKPHNQD
jgi:hypothetical protein